MEAKEFGAMTNTAPPAAEVEVDGQNEAITLPNQGEELNGEVKPLEIMRSIARFVMLKIR